MDTCFFKLSKGTIDGIFDNLEDMIWEYARYKMQNIIELYRKATYHMSALHELETISTVEIPFIGIENVEGYLNCFGGEFLEIFSSSLRERRYRLKDNQYVWLTVDCDFMYGNISLRPCVTFEVKAEERLIQKLRASALQGVVNLTKEQMIKKYNERYGVEPVDDKWCEPDGVLMYHGTSFEPVYDDSGVIIDLKYRH